MPNSSAVVDWKNRVISEMLANDELMSCFEKTAEELEEIVYSNIFPYGYIPDVQTAVDVYITVQVSIPKITFNKIWAYPRLTINIICHQDKMRLKKAGVSADRIDYMSVLIDNMFNGSEGWGCGKLELATNVEDNLSVEYKYRQMVFVGQDLSDSLCNKA